MEKSKRGRLCISPDKMGGGLKQMQQAITDDVKRVIHKYGWGKTHRVHNRKNAWYVVADKGTFFLKKSQIPSTKLSMLQELLTKIRKAGVTEILPFVHTKKGKALVTHTTGRWYATPWKQASQEQVDPLVAVRSLARLHRAAEPLVQPYNSLHQRVDQSMIDQWRKKQKMNAQLNQQILEKEFPSPFDKSFAAYYNVLDQSLNFAIRGMEKFVRLEKGKPTRYTLCHNRIHESNLIGQDDEFYWVDFDHAVIDSPVRDLAMFIRRYAHLAEPEELLTSYQEEFPLKPKEKRLLALYLAYPERILKQLRRYNEGVQISQESTEQRRLEIAMEQLMHIQQLIIQLWPSKKRGSKNQRYP